MIHSHWLRRLIPVWIFCCLTAGLLHGQQIPAKANALYKAGAYQDAARLYARHLKRHKSLEASLQLARCHKALGENAAAEARYIDVVFDPKAQPSHYMELGKHLKTMGKYSSAKGWFMKYAATSQDSVQGLKWARSCDLAMSFRSDSLTWAISHTGVANSKSSDISPVWYRNGFLFASNRQRGFFVRFFNSKSKEAFYDLYFAEVGADGRLGKAKYQRDNLNTRFHDGPITVTPAENVAYITRTNTEGLGTSRDAAGFSRVNIYRIEQHIDRWRKGTPVPYTSSEYNIAHPATSADGRTLYFASDMPGGYGGSDIYVSQLLPGGWTKPQNLGAEVNSEANEGYPFITGDSSIYFTSDRAEGLGGKDVFSAKRRFGIWSQVRNLGYPLNTPHDDFGFNMSPIKPIGFFTSNRPGGAGEDDLWAFKKYNRIEATFVDAITGLPIEGVRVELTDINQKLNTYSSNNEGLVTHTMRTGQDILAKAEIDGYEPWKELLSIRKLGVHEDLYKIVPLQPMKQFAVEGVIVDAATNTPLEKTVVRVIGPQEERRFTDAEGKFAVAIAPGEDYTIIYEREGYVPVVQNLTVEVGTAPTRYRYDAALKKGTALLVEGQTYDPERQHPLDAVAIDVLHAGNRKVLSTVTSRADGLFWFVLDEGRDYALMAAKPGYFTASSSLLRDSLVSDTAHLKLQLSPLKPGDVFHTIFYAYGKTDIASMGKSDLQALAYLLKANPDIRVELSSHTDSRGSSSFNKRLSQQRANQALDYLASLGVDRNRVDAIGYGEERLHNNCGDGIICAEELHAQNRRTELRVISGKAQAAPPSKEAIKSDQGPVGKDALKTLPASDTLPQPTSPAPVAPPLDSLRKDSAGLGQQAPWPGTYRDVNSTWRAPAVKLF